MNIKIGVEIEFYAQKYIEKDVLKSEIQRKYNDKIHYIDYERGHNQYEINLNYDTPELINTKIEQIKDVLIETGMILKSKPYKNQPGSSMQFSISIHDNLEKNVFFKQNSVMNNLLSFSIGGLLDLANQSMIFFLPKKESYLRIKNDFNVPTKISWGGNNRTAFLRIVKNDENNVRIEHRICGIDCDYRNSLSAIIFSIYHGIKYRIHAPEKIYGNVYNHYNLLSVSMSYEKSLEYFKKEKTMQRYFQLISLEQLY